MTPLFGQRLPAQVVRRVSRSRRIGWLVGPGPWLSFPDVRGYVKELSLSPTRAKRVDRPKGTSTRRNYKRI